MMTVKIGLWGSPSPFFAFGYFVLAYGKWKEVRTETSAAVARSLAREQRFKGKDGTPQWSACCFVSVHVVEKTENVTFF